MYLHFVVAFFVVYEYGIILSFVLIVVSSTYKL